MATSRPAYHRHSYGETTGLRVELLDALLPYWEIDLPAVVGEGVTEVSGTRLTSNQVLRGFQRGIRCSPTRAIGEPRA